MNIKYHFRLWGWPILILIVLVAGIVFGTKYFVSYFLVDKTIEYYNDTKEKYSVEESPKYVGTIVDTVFQKSKLKKAKTDTIVRRQTVLIEESKKADDHLPSREEIGLLGDSTAIYNTIFAFLAFAGVILTFLYQMYKDSKDKVSAGKLQFEQEFFSMTTMLEDIVSHLEFKEPSFLVDDQIPLFNMPEGYQQEKTPDTSSDTGNIKVGDIAKGQENRIIEGRSVFKYLYADRPNYSLLNYVNNTTEFRLSEEAQRYCFDGTLDHYFRYLYRILKHIDESSILDEQENPDEDKAYYAHLLRAQLSTYELLMWYYNSLLPENRETAKVLIERYQMFDNLRVSELGGNERAINEAQKNMIITDDSLISGKDSYYKIGAYWSKKDLSKAGKEKHAKSKSNASSFQFPSLTFLFQKYGWHKVSNEVDENRNVKQESVSPAAKAKQDSESKKKEQKNRSPRSNRGSQRKAAKARTLDEIRNKQHGR